MRTQLTLLVAALLVGCTTHVEKTTTTVYQATFLGGCEDQHSEIISKQEPVPYTEQENSTECSAFVDLRYMSEEPVVTEDPPSSLKE